MIKACCATCFPNDRRLRLWGIAFAVFASPNLSSSNKLRHSSLIICFYWLAPASSFPLLCAITFTLPSFSPFDILFAVRSICFCLRRRYALASLVQAAYWITLINSCKWPLKLHQNKHGRPEQRIGMFGKQILLLISLCSVEVLTLVGQQHKNIPKWKKQVLVINYSINSFH